MWGVLRLVLDTNVLISARRSATGASNYLVRAGLSGAIRLLVSVPLFLEYEAVLARPGNRRETGLSLDGLNAFLDLLALEAEEVEIYYLWRPQLGDFADEMVLETAINGRADHIVTFNEKHFRAASRFGIDVASPSKIVRKLR